MTRVLTSILVVLFMLGSHDEALADGPDDRPQGADVRCLERATATGLVIGGSPSPGPLASSAKMAARTTVPPTASRDAGYSAASSQRHDRNFVSRHPVLVGAIVGAVVGGSGAFAKWGSEGTWVGVWVGAGVGGGVGALVSR